MCDCSPCPATIVHYKEPTDYVNIDIHAFPLPPPPPPPPKPGVPPHLQKILDKYPYNWRIEQLSKQIPHKIRTKYTGPPKPAPKKTHIVIPEIEFYTDHLSRPPIWRLVLNSKETKSRKRKAIFKKTIKKAWNSIYNYYKKKLRDRKLRALKAKKATKKPKKTIDPKFYDRLATPKKAYVPPKVEPKKKKLLWKDCPRCIDNVDTLATPNPRQDPPTKPLGWISPAALKYKATPTIIRLGKPFSWYSKILPPVEVGKIKPSALQYRITPRLEEMALPKKRSEKEVEDSEFDPWAVSKNALKYKATPRILELAKPSERD